MLIASSHLLGFSAGPHLNKLNILKISTVSTRTSWTHALLILDVLAYQFRSAAQREYGSQFLLSFSCAFFHGCWNVAERAFDMSGLFSTKIEMKSIGKKAAAIPS